MRTLELSGLDEYYALQKVASFATLVATYEKGMCVHHMASLLSDIVDRIPINIGAL